MECAVRTAERMDERACGREHQANAAQRARGDECAGPTWHGASAQDQRGAAFFRFLFMKMASSSILDPALIRAASSLSALIQRVAEPAVMMLTNRR